MPNESSKPFIRVRTNSDGKTPIHPRETDQRRRHWTIRLARAVGEKLDEVSLKKFEEQNEQRILQLAKVQEMIERDELVSLGGAITPPVRMADGSLYKGWLSEEFDPASYDF